MIIRDPGGKSESEALLDDERWCVDESGNGSLFTPSRRNFSRQWTSFVSKRCLLGTLCLLTLCFSLFASLQYAPQYFDGLTGMNNFVFDNEGISETTKIQNDITITAAGLFMALDYGVSSSEETVVALTEPISQIPIKAVSDKENKTFLANTSSTNPPTVVSNQPLSYKRHELTKNLRCDLYFENTPAANETVEEDAKHRVAFPQKENDHLDISCEAIRARGHFPDKPLTQEESDFPIAFARIVYTDYYFLEMQFRMDFMPQNQFCFILDQKASELFQSQIRNLERCFPANVVVPFIEYNVESSGHNVSMAHLTCMMALRNRDWRYIVLFQNHDVKFKTNAELVEIFKIFNGTNDISAAVPVGHTYPHDADYSLSYLQIFKKHPERNNATAPDGKPIVLKLAKSLVEVSVSREAAEYIIDELDVSRFLGNLERVRYGMDENFIGTLNSNDFLGLPGGFTHSCLDAKHLSYMITRLSIWLNGPNNCRSKYNRHNICVLGIQELSWIAQQPGIIANKFLPSFDFGAIDCMGEWLFNKTYVHSETARIDARVYENLTHVRFNKWKNAGKNVTEFKCK